MTTRYLSEHVLLITLPAEPHESNELEVAAQSVSAGDDRHVIVDFSQAGIMPSRTICGLIILERLLSARNGRLILCSVPADIDGIFRRVGLKSLFRFAGDPYAALRLLEHESCSS